MSFPIQCASCKHYREKLKCDAFPDGIPNQIISSKFDHTKPYKGDHDIRFEDDGTGSDGDEDNR